MFLKRLRILVLPALVLLAAGCGQTPATTEQARGVLTGFNIVAALTVLLIVVAGGVLVGVLGLDRFVSTRKRLADNPPEPEPDTDEVVAGITVGRAGVPRWLYGFYVIIPVFAFAYVLANIPLAEAPADEGGGEGPVATCEGAACNIVAVGIQFDVDALELPADTEVTVNFDNQDAGLPHSFTVWENEAAATGGTPIADTGLFNGVAEQDVTWTSGAAGTENYFNCTVHPAMAGTVTYGAGGGEGGEEPPAEGEEAPAEGGEEAPAAEAPAA